jgi:hypothetical protein
MSEHTAFLLLLFNMYIIISILIKDLKFELFMSKMDNARKSSSVYRYVIKHGDILPRQILMQSQCLVTKYLFNTLMLLYKD